MLTIVCAQLSGFFLADSKTDSNRKECGIIRDITDGLKMAGEEGGGRGWGMMNNDFI